MPSFERVDMLYAKNDGAWVSLWADFYMTHEDQVFIVNVVIIDLTQETMITSVISWPTSASAKLNAIIKIRKSRRLHEKHHCILMAMGVHDAPRCDMDHFIREYACFFHDRQSRYHLVLSIYI
jgi:hypothetical protein